MGLKVSIGQDRSWRGRARDHSATHRFRGRGARSRPIRKLVVALRAAAQFERSQFSHRPQARRCRIAGTFDLPMGQTQLVEPFSRPQVLSCRTALRPRKLGSPFDFDPSLPSRFGIGDGRGLDTAR